MKLIKLDSSDVKTLDNISKTHPPNRFVYPAFGVSSFPLLVFLQLLILYSRSTSVSPISNRRCSTFDEPDDAGKLEDASRASDEGYSRNHTMIAAIISSHLYAISPSFYLIFVPCRVALPPFHHSILDLPPHHLQNLPQLLIPPHQQQNIFDIYNFSSTMFSKLLQISTRGQDL